MLEYPSRAKARASKKNTSTRGCVLLQHYQTSNAKYINFYD